MTELADAPLDVRTGPAPRPDQATPAVSDGGGITPRFLADVHDAAAQCNRCSLCQAVCPTYVVNPVEWETARGRVALIRDAIEGRIELRDIAEGPLSTCLTCNNCMAACAPGVDTARIVSRARQELHAQEGHPRGQTLLLRGILPRPGAMRLLRGLARAGEATGVLPLARRSGVTRLMGVPGAMLEMTGRLPARSAYRRARDIAPPPAPRGRVGLVMCCVQNIVAPDATEATMRVLTAAGYEVVVPSLGCTGLPGKSQGDRDAELEMARRTVETLAPLDVDLLVGDVASCTEQVRDAGSLLAGEGRYAAAAARVSARTVHASTLLAERGIQAPLGRLRWTVAIDEPCALPHEGPERSAAARLLAQVPGLRVVPLTEAAMCCGGAGAYFHSEPERSAAILARKMENVVRSGAQVLVTENVSCLNQLREGARRHAPSVRVLHVMEVLAESIDVERRRGLTRGGSGASLPH